MQKEWSSYRITLLLYFVVLLLPVSFYFIYTSFQTMQKDTTIVRKSSWIPGAMEHLRNNSGQQQIKAIDRSFDQLSLWTQQNSTSDLYIGGNTLIEDLKEVTDCWAALKKDRNVQCYDVSNDLAVVIEKMVYLKQKKIINIFYMSLALGMILTLLTIYLVRTYIHMQMKKHAIIDVETTLYNKTYFLSSLKSMHARSVRHQYPLSTLKVELEGFEKGGSHDDKKSKAETLKAFGKLLNALIRDGDVAARYDKNHFIILLPFTNKSNALHFENRIRQSLMQDDCIISEKIKMNFTIKELDTKETEEDFLQRTLAT